MTLKKATLLFSVFLVLLSFSLSLLPGHNGDMPFYIAAVFSRQGVTDQEALSQAKIVIQREMPAEEAAIHIYRIDHAEKNLLDFYRIKPAYIYLIRILHWAGIPFIPATLIPSLISFLLIGCIVFSWSAKTVGPLPALVFSMILMLINPSVIVARLSTPDSLSNLFLFYCFYRIYFDRGNRLTMLLLIVAILVRLDNLVAVWVLLTLMKVLPPGKSGRTPGWLMYLFFVLLAGGVAIGVNYCFEQDFWWFKQIAYVQSWHAYELQVLIYFLSLSQSFFPALLLLSFLALFNRKLNWGKKPAPMLISIGFILFVRFLLFPSFEERFETAFYLTGFLLIQELLLPQGGDMGNSPGSLMPDPQIKNK